MVVRVRARVTVWGILRRISVSEGYGRVEIGRKFLEMEISGNFHALKSISMEITCHNNIQYD